MHLGIDATNIRQGGGVTHLVQLLSAANPQAQGISKITIWCNSNVAQLLPIKPWLAIRTPLYIDSSLIARFIFQHFILSLQMISVDCTKGFFPGGTLPILNFIPAVTMSQNMLPFELEKAKIFGENSFMYLKLQILRILQEFAFRRARGLIFLSNYAQKKINQKLNLYALQAIIPHGVEPRFISAPKIQKSIQNYSNTSPFRFLYVSILMPYKHQIEVVRAIEALYASGLPITCQLIGSAWSWYGEAVISEIKKIDPSGNFIEYSGEIPFAQLHDYYHKSDAFIFASSCENLPNILIEAMAAGLPIACSHAGPMPEILGEDGFYFDPTSCASIEGAIKDLIYSVKKRTFFVENANLKVVENSWQDCADRTFEFIKK
jgi:glycosyltransferase involved in cell wall biosynthesis